MDRMEPEIATQFQVITDAVVDEAKKWHDLSGKLLLRTAYYRQTLDYWTRNLSRPARSGAEEGAVMTKEQCESLKSLGYLPVGSPCPSK
jgi:hypothetical protein